MKFRRDRPISFPEDVEVLRKALAVWGLFGTDSEIQAAYEGYSSDRWCAGWMTLNDEIVREFCEYVEARTDAEVGDGAA